MRRGKGPPQPRVTPRQLVRAAAQSSAALARLVLMKLQHWSSVLWSSTVTCVTRYICGCICACGAPPTCRVLTTSCIFARPRSRKLSIRSPSMNPVACSVFRSVWKDLQVLHSQGKSIQGCDCWCPARGLHLRYNNTVFSNLRHKSTEE